MPRLTRTEEAELAAELDAGRYDPDHYEPIAPTDATDIPTRHGMVLGVRLDPDTAERLEALARDEHVGRLVAAAETLIAEGLAAYEARVARRARAHSA